MNNSRKISGIGDNSDREYGYETDPATTTLSSDPDVSWNNDSIAAHSSEISERQSQIQTCQFQSKDSVSDGDLGIFEGPLPSRLLNVSVATEDTSLGTIHSLNASELGIDHDLNTTFVEIENDDAQEVDVGATHPLFTIYEDDDVNEGAKSTSDATSASGYGYGLVEDRTSVEHALTIARAQFKIDKKRYLEGCPNLSVSSSASTVSDVGPTESEVENKIIRHKKNRNNTYFWKPKLYRSDSSCASIHQAYQLTSKNSALFE